MGVWFNVFSNPATLHHPRQILNINPNISKCQSPCTIQDKSLTYRNISKAAQKSGFFSLGGFRGYERRARLHKVLCKRAPRANFNKIFHFWDTTSRTHTTQTPFRCGFMFF
jgi:hypothetical protein